MVLWTAKCSHHWREEHLQWMTKEYTEKLKWPGELYISIKLSKLSKFISVSFFLSIVDHKWVTYKHKSSPSLIIQWGMIHVIWSLVILWTAFAWDHSRSWMWREVPTKMLDKAFNGFPNGGTEEIWERELLMYKLL